MGITADKTWVYFHDQDTKLQLSQWQIQEQPLINLHSISKSVPVVLPAAAEKLNLFQSLKLGILQITKNKQ